MTDLTTRNEFIARHIGPAPHAHARIDDWAAGQAWIEARFDGAPVEAA